jgi:hypothetical protein
MEHPEYSCGRELSLTPAHVNHVGGQESDEGLGQEGRWIGTWGEARADEDADGDGIWD